MLGGYFSPDRDSSINRVNSKRGLNAYKPVTFKTKEIKTICTSDISCHTTGVLTVLTSYAKKVFFMPETQEDIAYTRLKDLILDGKLEIGEFLSQRKLADKVKTAVVTVRGALRTLENEGLIENVPRWGVRIPPLTEESARDRNYMREVLETAGVEKIAGSLSEEKAEKLRTLAETCDSFDYTDKDQIRDYAEAHLAFHLFISECSGSPLLSSSLEHLLARDRMVLNARFGWARGTVSTEKNHHSSLAEIIIGGPLEKAKTAIKKHVQDGIRSELEAIKESQKLKEKS